MDININYVGAIGQAHRMRVAFDLAHAFVTVYENVPVRLDGIYTIDGQTVTLTADERRLYFHRLYEDGWKGSDADFVVRDQTRDVQEVSAVPRINNGCGDECVPYDCAIRWTVHGRVEIDASLVTDKTGADLSLALSEAGERAAMEWIANRPLTPLE